MASLRWLTSSCSRFAHSPEMSFCARARVDARVSAARTTTETRFMIGPPKLLPRSREGHEASTKWHCTKPSSCGLRDFVSSWPTGLSLYRHTVHINPSDVDEPAPAVSAAGHEIGEADFVDLAEIRMLNPASDLGR